ncbi:hypothetical protein N5P37_006321 [Trichoderma harzianum]|nr:hypothetical protein N5P37_006321 [Trichoderma harzianum]
MAQAKEKVNPVSSSQMTSGEVDRGESLTFSKEPIDSATSRSQPQLAESSKKRAVRSTKNIAASNKVPSKRAKSGNASARRPKSTNKDADGNNVNGVIKPVVPLVFISAKPVAPRRSSRSTAANTTALIKDRYKDSISSAVEAKGLPPTPPSIPRPKAGNKAKGKAKAPAINKSTLVDDLILDKGSLIDKLLLNSNEYLNNSDNTLEEFNKPLDKSNKHLDKVDKEDGTNFLSTNNDSFILFKNIVDEANNIEINNIIAIDTEAQVNAAL